MSHITDAISTVEEYLRDGGLGEVMIGVGIAHDRGDEKVQMDTSMAIALCLIADRALKRERLQ